VKKKTWFEVREVQNTISEKRVINKKRTGIESKWENLQGSEKTNLRETEHQLSSLEAEFGIIFDEFQPFHAGANLFSVLGDKIHGGLEEISNGMKMCKDQQSDGVFYFDLSAENRSTFQFERFHGVFIGRDKKICSHVFVFYIGSKSNVEIVQQLLENWRLDVFNVDIPGGFFFQICLKHSSQDRTTSSYNYTVIMQPYD